MAKLILNDIGNIITAATTINTNNQRIEDALENTLSRDGTEPNEMNSDFDMNNHRIYNLPEPKAATEPLRLQDLDEDTNLTVIRMGLTSPLTFGAIGDGVANDIEAWRKAEDKGNYVYVPAGSTFNLGSNIPAKPIWGSGAVIINGLTYNGFQTVVYGDRSSTYLNPTGNPSSTWLYSDFPATSGHANTVVGSATSRLSDSNFTRNTVLGSHAGQQAVSWNRNEAIGQGAMRWSKYAERNTIVGSLAAQWAGANLTEDPQGQYYFHDLLWNGGVPPSDVAWNAFGLATKNPTIRTDIVSWLSSYVWPTASTEFDRNVALGRDALVEFSKGSLNAAGGYRSIALLMEGSRNSAWGDQSLFGLIFGDFNAALGSSSGFSLNKGEQNTFVANGAGYSIIEGNGNTILGSNAGFSSTFFKANYNVWIGYEAGRNTAVDVDNTLRIQNARDDVRVPLITGKFDTNRVGINILPENILGILDIRDASGNAALQVDTTRRLLVNHTTSIATASLNSQLQVHGTAASSSSSSVSRWSTGAGGPSFVLSKSRGTTQGTMTTVQSGDVLGDVIFAGADGTASLPGGRIRVLATGTIGTNIIPGQMQLSVSPVGSVTPTNVIDFTATTLGFFGATPVVRPTYGAPTGTATRTTFDTASVTLPQLAERVKAMIDDLRSYGLAA